MCWKGQSWTFYVRVGNCKVAIRVGKISSKSENSHWNSKFGTFQLNILRAYICCWKGKLENRVVGKLYVLAEKFFCRIRSTERAWKINGNYRPTALRSFQLHSFNSVQYNFIISNFILSNSILDFSKSNCQILEFSNHNFELPNSS